MVLRAVPAVVSHQSRNDSDVSISSQKQQKSESRFAHIIDAENDLISHQSAWKRLGGNFRYFASAQNVKNELRQMIADKNEASQSYSTQTQTNFFDEEVDSQTLKAYPIKYV